MSDEGVHFNKELDLKLKIMAQKNFEQRYSHEMYMQLFGRNYLEDEDAATKQHNAGGLFNIDEIPES